MVTPAVAAVARVAALDTDGPSTPSCHCSHTLGLGTHRLPASRHRTVSDCSAGTAATPPPTSPLQTSRSQQLCPRFCPHHPRCSRSSPSTARQRLL
eukprot:3433294-Prymnesium_polylepis.1